MKKFFKKLLPVLEKVGLGALTALITKKIGGK